MSAPRRDIPEYPYLTTHFIDNIMSDYWDNRGRLTTTIQEKGVIFRINSNYKPPNIVDHESENTNAKFGNFPSNEGRREHSEERRQAYWDTVNDTQDHILNGVLTRADFSTERTYMDERRYTGPFLNYYNGDWVVDRFAISNNGQFALIRANRTNMDEPRYIFLYDLHADLLIGVRRFELNTSVDAIESGLYDRLLFGVPERPRGGTNKKTKRSNKTNRKSKKRGKNSIKRRRKTCKN